VEGPRVPEQVGFVAADASGGQSCQGRGIQN
jgi:hypothetical protein